MILLRHLASILMSTMAFGIRTRRFQVVVLVMVGLALLSVALTAKVVAPVVVYPFV